MRSIIVRKYDNSSFQLDAGLCASRADLAGAAFRIRPQEILFLDADDLLQRQSRGHLPRSAPSGTARVRARAYGERAEVSASQGFSINSPGTRGIQPMASTTGDAERRDSKHGCAHAAVRIHGSV